MKTFRLLCFAALCAAFFTGCDKDPFAQTETGEGTLGCKINGEDYVSYSYGLFGRRDLKIYYTHDSAIGSDYEFSLSAFCHQSSGNLEVRYALHIYIKSSQLLQVGDKYHFTTNNPGNYASWKKASANSGYFTLRKLERVKTESGSEVIVAGNFEFETQVEPESPEEAPVKYVCTEGTFDTTCETDVL